MIPKMSTLLGHDPEACGGKLAKLGLAVDSERAEWLGSSPSQV